MELHIPQFIDQLSADHLHGNSSPLFIGHSILARGVGKQFLTFRMNEKKF